MTEKRYRQGESRSSRRERLREWLADSERGVALPIAVLATSLGLAFSTIVVISSVSTQGGDSHAQASGSALAAAEAAANLAILRQNQLTKEGKLDPAAEETCVVVSKNGAGEEETIAAKPTTTGWCEPVSMDAETVPPAPADTTAEYRVKPDYRAEEISSLGLKREENTIRVIAIGSKGVGERSPVTRRIEVTAKAALSDEAWTHLTDDVEEKSSEEHRLETVKAEIKRVEEEEKALEESGSKSEGSSSYNPFNDGQIVGIESLYLSGNSKIYNGGAGSNGRVQIIDSSKVCGPLRYGPGYPDPVGGVSYVPEPERQYSNGTGGGVCYPPGYPITQGTVEYPQVKPPANIATDNSNWRLTEKKDPVPEGVWERGNVNWNPSNRELSLNYSSLTLEGTSLTLEGTAPYFLCKLTVTGGSTLYSGTGRAINIFFDEPKNCPGLNGSPQLVINGGTHIEADSNGGPGFYLLGSPSNPSESRVYFGNGASSAHLVIYAPNSQVEVTGGINLNGAILGRTLKLEGGAIVNPDAAYTPPPAEEFVEIPPQEEGGTQLETEKRAITEHRQELEAEQNEIERHLQEIKTEISRLEEEEHTFLRGAFVECAAGGGLEAAC